MKDPITQATDRHHAEEADYQRRYDAMAEEIYADLPAHLDEIVEFTDTEAVVRQLLTASISNTREPRIVKLENVNRVADAAILAAVKKIVERRLE